MRGIQWKVYVGPSEKRIASLEYPIMGTFLEYDWKNHVKTYMTTPTFVLNYAHYYQLYSMSCLFVNGIHWMLRSLSLATKLDLVSLLL